MFKIRLLNRINFRSLPTSSKVKNPRVEGLRLKSSGFTLIEVLVGTAVFVVVAFASYQAFVSLYQLVSLTQYKIAAINLINEKLEIVRNLPYSDVGIPGSIPPGRLERNETVVRNGLTFNILTTVRNIDLPFDGTIGGSPNDLSPADNKLVEVEVSCDTCKGLAPITLTTNVAPKNLETASTNGALFIRVFDANGQPVSGANVHVVNSLAVPTITIDDTTNDDGMLQIVDAPPGNEAYQITVSKSGYSTDRTYTTGAVGNPSPLKPNASVLLQQVTQVSFSIDKVSTVNFSSMTETCAPVAGIDFTMTGSKTIGTGVSKYSASHVTNGSGSLTLSNVEWDTYTLNISDGSYDLIGLNPLNPIAVNPDTTQKISIIVASKEPKSLLVTVKDSSTLLPVTDATVILERNNVENYKTTDRGYLGQTDWSGGSGQTDFVDSTKYLSSDGGISVDSPVGDLTLTQAFGNYLPTGYIESSIFDTGSASNFHHLIWNPTDQPVSAGVSSVMAQIATNATVTATSTWDFKGPDGTVSTYYTYPYQGISSEHDSDRFLKYRVYLSTANSATTPNVSDVNFTYTSSCTPPGQVIYKDLSTDDYTLSVGKPGYATTTLGVTINGAWKEQEVILAP